MSVKVHYAQEVLLLFHFLGRGKVSYGLVMTLKWVDSILVHAVTLECDRGHRKITFGGVDLQTILLKDG
jgi:hypothetical protein